MSEAITKTPAPVASAASLYPADGGAAAAVAGALPADTLGAGTGADTVAAGADTAASTVVAGAGTDSVTAGTGTDTVAADAGADTLQGGNGADSVAAPEYTFTLPAGFAEDTNLMTEAKTVLAAAGVAPDKAQPLIDLFGKAVTASATAQAAAQAAQQTTWLSEINAMPEFTGPTRETSLASIGRLFDEYGTPEAKAALDGGLKVGNNPALAKMMLKIATVMNEGAPAAGGRPIGQADGKRVPKTVGAALYENDGKGPTRN